jgi:hypothetical protein
MKVSGQFHGPDALPPGKESLVPIRQEAGWATEPVSTRWRREKFPAPAGTGNPYHPARSLGLYHRAAAADDDNNNNINNNNSMWQSSSQANSHSASQ